MNRMIGVLALAVCLGTLGCLGVSGPSAVRNEEGPIPPHIANKGVTPHGKAGTLAPWIADGKPGILAPSDDFKTGVITGLVHGVGVQNGSSRWIVEQWLLMKEDVAAPDNGLKLAKFPEFLPLVEKDTIHEDRLVWGFGRYPSGYPSPTMDFKTFYDWAVPIVAPKEHAVAYGFGIAGVHQGIPPNHLDGISGKEPIDLETEGYIETFTVTDTCRFTVFAESRFSPYTNKTTPFINRFERSRRIVQAWDTKSCASLSGTGADLSTASTLDAPRKKYREWLDIIKGWQGANVSYTNGVVLLDDDFAGEPMDLQDLEKQIAPLLAPKEK